MTARPHDPRLLAGIAAGGVVGALGRWGVSAWLPNAHDGAPWGTFAVNVTGAFAMGLLVAWLAVRPGAHPFVRPVLATGVLGGWTTFSALALDVHTLTRASDAPVAIAYVVVTFVLGVAACGLGEAAGTRWWPDAPDDEVVT
ncbi:fluoride efflux transporter CrcB [Kribbia dieselivorans]|uniref:fluoride efflux transporter CrcB n=1 Tax=Kribbia dieselivorans TaxID=331526 RepID=UPI00083931B3|nr:fluoride efflux transporter CrcB [Kribbia dieselivorans]